MISAILCSMYRYCGKTWTTEDLERIKELVGSRPQATRAELSRLVCEMFDWRTFDGKLKAMSCRVAMIRMERDGLIKLPLPTRRAPRPYQLVTSKEGDPQPDLCCSVQELAELRVVPVRRGPELKLWNEFIGRYHYLGYKMLPGAQLRYFIRDGERYLGAMGFGAAAWKVAPRDTFIGWNAAWRQERLHLIVNQARFLILPWVHCRNLASKSLALVGKRLCTDWETHYGYRPVLMETFVDCSRFSGTCYKAGGWGLVGHTQGRGKLDRFHAHDQPVKSIWLKPLTPKFREELQGGRTP